MKKSFKLFLILSIVSISAYAWCTVTKSYTYEDGWGDTKTCVMQATASNCGAAEGMANSMAATWIRNHYAQ